MINALKLTGKKLEEVKIVTSGAGAAGLVDDSEFRQTGIFLRDEGTVKKYFNVNADCKQQLHYMVDISERLGQIKAMIDAGKYFTINRARQYGKTTTLKALERILENDYTVISLDFQMVSHADFEKEESFVEAFSGEILDTLEGDGTIPPEIKEELEVFAAGEGKRRTLSELFRCLSRWSRQSEKKIVLMIDEVDSASNNQVFLDFLALLRGYYINRDRKPTFHSVILAGVYDVKNLKRKIVPEDEGKRNSPWNIREDNEPSKSMLLFGDCPRDHMVQVPYDIAEDFLIEMSFSAKDIEGMLLDYENDYGTGMNIPEMAQMIFDYTGGYPFLVSRLCKLLDEQVAGCAEFPDRGSAWSRDGLLEAVSILLHEKNTLFDSMIGKLEAYPELKEMINLLLFQGQGIVYNPDDDVIGLALMFGFVKTSGASVCVANRIFETRLYNYFLTAPQVQRSDMYRAATQDKNQFIENGHLNIRLVLEKFVLHFNDLYGDQDQTFYEEDGRRYFLLYLRPIINGNGNYYIEAQTRNRERTDVIIDYGGEQSIVELKVWRGDAYHKRGEKQLMEYLEYYHLDKGYMLSFNFNKHKEIGVKEICLDGRILIEALC